MRWRTPVILVLTSLVSWPAWAGGGWVPKPGEAFVQLGASRKRAQSSWGVDGQLLDNQADHDFRYAYLSGEAGVWRGLAATWTITYLDGFEGRPGSRERNTGLSDSWFGLKYGVRQGASVPMAIAFTYRTPVFYDQPGAYDRHVYNSDGSFRGVSSEWRGLLKHDYTLSYLASRSLWRGRGWASLETGYTWRQGAPADQVPLSVDIGVPLPWWGIRVKTTGLLVRSLGNDSPRQPDDRFGASRTNNFNDASMARLGVSLLVPLDRQQRWYVEAGYNKWVWGRSARRYEEPFLSFGHGFY